MIELLRFLITIIIAYLVGKLVSKIKLPSILGWLITGMILGPHALSLMNQEILDAKWYEILIPILECTVGLMIGTELVWNKIKKSGKAIIITTLTQSLGTFIIVSLIFGIVLKIMNLPLYLAFIFGGIALATAPAPALSIVREFKTKGPVTNTLIPMAALDDIVGCIVFFTTIAIVARSLSTNNLSPFMIILVVLLPLLIGIATGFVTGFILKKQKEKKVSIAILLIAILITSGIGFLFNYVVLPKPVLNFMLIGMAFFLLILGHFLNIEFMYKVIIMSLGFFLILATRDSFQVYIEDVALNISNKEEQQKVMIDIEVYRKLGTLILSAIFTLILIKHELIVIEFILLGLSVVEIFINKKLCNKLKKIEQG